mmetsp:Transcript_68573/g.153663  ORF Transcript_68573/g.153663 Transcript_68573/m.153663 type:complete len:347 (-) Transcript_68573:161-1201(-)
MPIKQEVVDQLTGQWQIGLFETPCKAPLSFCYGFCCPCCMTCQQRLEILDVIGEPYVCCGGLFPCGPLGEPQDRNCIFLETCCCSGCALAGNRFLIQTRFDRENTCFDDFLLWVACLAPYVICILQCAGVDVPDEIENAVDCFQQIVSGCMLGQQQYELKYVKETGYQGPSQQIMGVMTPYQQGLMQQGKPPQQQMMGGAAVIGAAVGGAVGAGAMMSAVQGKPGGGRPSQVMGGGGFMNTVAPNGQPWSSYCGMSQPFKDGSGCVAGPWGECLAWAKVFEHQNPGYEQMPEYREDGPAGQVVSAMLSVCPGHMRQQIEGAAEQTEHWCEQAIQRGQPLPIINQRA